MPSDTAPDAAADFWLDAKKRLAGLTGLALMCFILATTLFGELAVPVQRGIVLLLGAGMILLIFPTSRRLRDKGSLGFWIDEAISLGFIAAIAYAMIYVFNDWFDLFSYRLGFPMTADLVVYGITILTSIEITRRTCGTTMMLVTLGFIGYLLLGPWLPGMFNHPGPRFEDFFEDLFGQGGIMGMALGLMAGLIYIFILYGAFLRGSGASEVIIRLATGATRKLPGGPAQSAILASMGFGSLSGSGPANVMATGSFTIPFMIRSGYPAKFAGSVEACASTVGQITPPVMGIVAFLMADITGIPYVDIVIASTVPCLLFYASLFLKVFFEAKRFGLRATAEEMPPIDRKVAIDGVIVASSAGLLIGLLAHGYSPSLACIGGIAVLLFGGLVSPRMRMGPRTLIEALINGARDGLSLLALCTAVGIILATISTTGIGLKFTNLVLATGGDSLLLALIATMVASLVLGMGLPTTPAYLLLAFSVSPALVKLGLPLMTAHLFVFYFGIISAITPPVAMSAFSAAAIARTNPMSQAVSALRLGATGFLIPYLMVYRSGILILDTGFIDSAYAILVCATAIVALAAAERGYLFAPLGALNRIVLAASAACLVLSGWETTILGAALFLGGVGAHWTLNRRTASAAGG